METELLKRITINPGIFNGKPLIRGLRIKVENVLALLEQGLSYKEILEEYPDLEEDDIRACLSFARAIITNEEIYDLNMEKSM